jgi:hypothetical protein
MPRTANYRFSLYFLINLLFAALVGVAYAAGGSPNPRLLYLVLLFALCRSALIGLICGRVDAGNPGPKRLTDDRPNTERLFFNLLT